MDGEEKKIEPSVQASDHSVAIETFAADNNSGNIQVGNITNIYDAPDPGKSIFTNKSIETQAFEPQTILIPEGTFWMGREPGEGVPVYETPRLEVFLPVYRLSKYPVTNRQYSRFVFDADWPVNAEMNWDGRNVPSGCEEMPVTGVRLDDARKYCEWLSSTTGRKYTIPNEAQLEKAFQGPYGCSDGDEPVYQWTCTLWGLKANAPGAKYHYPWKADIERNNLNANSQVRRVVCLYPRQEGTYMPGAVQRFGKFPWDPGFPKAWHGFRVALAA